MKTIHYIQLVLGVLAGAAQSFAANEPQYASVAHATASAATSLLLALGMVSPPVGASPAPAPVVNVTNSAPPAPTAEQPMPVRVVA